jgi:hypothetical protein
MKSKAKGKSDQPSRRPKQKGKVKKSTNALPQRASIMRTHLPPDMKREAEVVRLQENGVAPAVARNVANWRSKHQAL